jgi:hypothetical protein
MSFDESPVREFQQELKRGIEDSFNQVVINLIGAINTAGTEGDKIRYSNAVMQLVYNLPEERREYLLEHEELYTSIVEEWVYMKSCGQKMGTPEKPIYRNYPSDWNWDGGEPVIVSPIKNIQDEINYQKLFGLVMTELESAQAIWKTAKKDLVGKNPAKIPKNIPIITLKDGSYVMVKKDVVDVDVE